MSKLNHVASKGAILAVVLLGSSPATHAQSPYGLAARETIPLVIDQRDERGPVWDSEVNVHNPGPQCIKVFPNYFGAVGTATPGRLPCSPQVVLPGKTKEFSLRSACPQLNLGVNYGRFELYAEGAGPEDDEVCLPPSKDPADLVFLSNARVSRRLGGRYFTVEGFPQGNLSGNKSFAVVTGLKSGFIDGSQWETRCYGAALNEITQVFVELKDQSLGSLGFASAPLDPPSGIEVQPFVDVFTAVGAPPGNYNNVTAFFSTWAQGGQGGSGLAAFCRIINVTFDKEAFEVAKYLDNNDEGRQYRTVMTRTRWNKPLWIVPEIDHDDMLGETNLHAAYFQHPDRVTCRVRQTAPSGCKGLATFDEIQMRLIDPDDNIVAGGPGQTEFTFAPEEKSQRHDGRNGRWLVEVAPGRGCLDDQSLHQGGLAVTPYELICSSGNGHNELDSIGHCMMSCVKDPQNKHQALCPFDSPFNPARCYN